MSTPKTALEIITTWTSNAAIRQAFGSLGAYREHLNNPESSALQVIEAGGKATVIANKNRSLSPTNALEIVNNWKGSAAIRAEFKSLNTYRAYCEAAVTGKARIIGAPRQTSRFRGHN